MTFPYPRVAVLLATFNGEKYLAQQLDSLVGQSYAGLIVVTRDDGSTDRTVDIISSYRAKYPDTFYVIENDGRKLGACGSFSFLMEYALAHKKELGLESAYIMFCDQDDIWAKKKVELEMRRMQQTETGEKDIPVLVYSDLKVISGSGDLVAESFRQYQGLNPENSRFGNIIFCNPATGCTALVNEFLAQLSLPVPEAAVMHDWWLALVASAFGRLAYIDRPLVEYRQHRTNTFGAREKKSYRSPGEVLQKIRTLNPDPSLRERAAQADVFLDRYRTRLSAGRKIRLKMASVLRIRSAIGQRVVYGIGRRF